MIRATASQGWARWRAQPFTSRAIFGVVTLALVLGPVALTLAREPDYGTSIEIFPAKIGPFPAPRTQSHFEEIAARGQVQEGALALAGLRESPDLIDSVRFAPSPEPRETYLMSVNADTPQDSVALTDSLASLIAQESADEVEQMAGSRLAEVQDELESAPSADQPALEAQEAPLRELIRDPLPQFVLGPRPAAPVPEGAVDKAVDALPGEMPPRPDPVWVALAGLLLAAAVLFAWLVRAGPPPADCAGRRPLGAGARGWTATESGG